MKKLCILSGGHFSDAPGGAEYQAGLIADELAKTGEYDLYYLALAIEPSWQAHGYQLIQINKRNYFNQHAFFFDSLSLYKILKDIRPDIIYQRVLMAYTGVAAYFSKKNDCRLIFHVSSEFDVSPFGHISSSGKLLKYIDRKIGEYGIRHADAVIAQTEQQANLFKDYYGREVTAVIGNFHPLPTEKISKKDPIKVIWVANFKPNKRPEIFVKLASDFRHLDGVKFIMIGHPGNLKRYSALNKEIKKLSNLEFIGLQPLEQVNKQLSQSHIFVNTSIKEGFPNTFIQAWMRQLPVVSLDVDLDGLLARGEVGFLSGDYDTLKANVQLLLANPQLRTKLGIRARDYAFKNNSPKTFRQLLQVIKG